MILAMQQNPSCIMKVRGLLCRWKELHECNSISGTEEPSFCKALDNWCCSVAVTVVAAGAVAAAAAAVVAAAEASSPLNGIVARFAAPTLTSKMGISMSCSKHPRLAHEVCRFAFDSQSPPKLHGYPMQSQARSLCIVDHLQSISSLSFQVLFCILSGR